MAVFFLIDVLQSLWSIEFIRSSTALGLLLHAVISLLSFFLHPMVLGLFIVAAPLIALRKHRSVVAWLLLGVLLGPFALGVAALPPLEDSRVRRGEERRQMPPFARRRVDSRRSALLLLFATWVVAYFYSFGRHLTDDFLLTIQLVPAALVFGWALLPGNMFRVITGVEPGPHLMYAMIAAFWLVLIPLHVAFVRSRLQIVLIAIVAISLMSSHGCYHWVNYESLE